MPSIPKGYLQIATPITSATFSDGDIISAVPWRAVRQERAEGVCFGKGLVNGQRRHLRQVANGLYPLGDVSEDYLEATKEYRFERLGQGEGRVIRLADGDSITFQSNVPFIEHSGKVVSMDIPRFVSRAVATLSSTGGRGKPIFGTPGNEVWYGGTSTILDSNLDQIWLAIEAKTTHTELIECDEAKFSDYRKRLILRVDNFTDAEADKLSEPEIRQRTIRIVPNSIQKVPRGWRVDLRDALPPLGNRPDATVIDGEDRWIIENINSNRLTIVLRVNEVRPTPGPKTLEATVGKRKRRVQWRSLAGIDEASVLDRQKVVRRDRQITDVLAVITEEKADNA